MKRFFSIFLALTFPNLAQEQTSDTKSASTDKPQFIIELEALTQEQKQKYFTHFHEADRFFKQKRIFECLEQIHLLHQIYDKNPNSLNLQGACYVEFRDFKKAYALFSRAKSAGTESFNINFNLAEINFVTGEYQKALEQMSALKTEIGDKRQFAHVAPLINFKIFLCHLKLGDRASAESILAGTNFLDDSPLFYYANAALHFYSDQRVEAEKWLARAGRIFTNKAVTGPWNDTLIEFGYIKNFYGGDLETSTPRN